MWIFELYLACKGFNGVSSEMSFTWLQGNASLHENNFSAKEGKSKLKSIQKLSLL